MDLITIAVIACICSAFLSARHWHKCVYTDCRTFDDCINDIRAMNTYNSYFFSAIVIFFGFTIGEGKDIVSTSSAIMLLSAFVFASCAIFFIPFKKSINNNDVASKNIKWLWLYTLLLSQWTVISCVFGVISVIAQKLF